VGLGDFTPRSNIERFLGALFMLFGATITSYIMEILSKVSVKIGDFNKPFEDYNKLNQFIDTLTYFNQNEPIPPKLKEGLESYFRYRWEMNKNVATSTAEDLELLE